MIATSLWRQMDKYISMLVQTQLKNSEHYCLYKLSHQQKKDVFRFYDHTYIYINFQDKKNSSENFLIPFKSYSN